MAGLLILGDKNVVKEFSCGNIAFLSCPCYSIKRREPPERGKAGKLFLYGTPRANLLLHRSEIQRSFYKKKNRGIFSQGGLRQSDILFIFYSLPLTCDGRRLAKEQGVNKALGLQ